MRYEVNMFELEFDSVSLKARNLTAYLKYHPEDTYGSIEALYDYIATLKIENRRLIRELAKSQEPHESQPHPPLDTQSP